MKRLALALCALAFVALGVMLERRVTALERRALDWDRHFGYKSRFPFCGEWHKPYQARLMKAGMSPTPLKSIGQPIPSPAQEWIKNHTNVPRELPKSFIEAYRKRYGLNNQTGDKENVPTD